MIKGGVEMSRQLNLRVSDEFVTKLERLSEDTGARWLRCWNPLGPLPIEAAEEDAQFEADALTAWEEYQLNGVCVTSEAIDDIFAEALDRARSAGPGRRS